MNINFKYVFLIFGDYVFWSLVSIFCSVLISLLISDDKSTFIQLSAVSFLWSFFYGVPLTLIMIILRERTGMK